MDDNETDLISGEWSRESVVSKWELGCRVYGKGRPSEGLKSKDPV